MTRYARSLFAAAVTGLVCFAGSAFAQCSEERYHVTKRGEDLFRIARLYYDDPEKWSSILNANLRVLGGNPNHVPQGIRLRIPCITDTETGDDEEQRGEELVKERAINPNVELKLLTGGAYDPFTDQDLENGGLVTEIVNTALANAPNPVTYGVFWDDDWSRHFDLLRRGEYHLGFPWLKPNCEDKPDQDRCRDFLFSQPIFEMVVMLFVHEDAPVNYRQESDIEGLTICRPKGYYTHDLETQERQWLQKNLITLVQPDTPRECFLKLANKEVDAVSMNEFTGRTVMQDLGLNNCIKLETKPISIQGLHAITYKRHWRATAHRARFDEGVRHLKEQAEYNKIVDRHMSNHWSKIEGNPAQDNCDPEEKTGMSDQTSPEGDDNLLAQREKVLAVFADFRFLAPNVETDSAGRFASEKDLTEVSYQSSGSAFLIAPDLVLTNAHVVAGSDNAIVANSAVGVVEAEVVAWSDRFQVGDLDLATLKLARSVDISPVRFSPLAEDLDPVVAMGYPGLLLKSDRDTARFMEVLVEGREPETYPDMIPTRGAVQTRRRNFDSGVEELLHGSKISPGNSGGPLFDICGRVVGINTLTFGSSEESVVQYEAAQTAVEIAGFLKSHDIPFEMEETPCEE